MGSVVLLITRTITSTSSPQNMKVALILALTIACVAASPRVLRLSAPRNDLTCTLCVDIITDIDNFITSDTSEQQIVDFAKQLCDLIGMIVPDMEAACDLMIETQLPSIIRRARQRQPGPHHRVHSDPRNVPLNG